jgi:epoxyqueuosine reductase
MLCHDEILKIGQEIGFDACGFARAHVDARTQLVYKKWLSDGFHADMDWMETNIHLRFSPQLLVEKAATVIVVLYSFHTKLDIFEKSPVRIAQYAWRRDYHKTLKKKLKAFYNALQQKYPELQGRYFVDSAPVAERYFAVQAGLGWIGKSGMLINPVLGTNCFIGTIILNQETDKYDEPVENRCGTCQICIEACPTRAIVSNSLVDSNKCISYRTIEMKLDSEKPIHNGFSGFIFGCDLCQTVCPWNNKAVAFDDRVVESAKKWGDLTAKQWQSLSETEYMKMFEGTPVKRASFEKIKSNINKVLIKR